MRFITTMSGSEYITTVDNGNLYVHKVDGDDPGWTKALAVYEDRYAFLEATAKWTREGEFVCGYNNKGTRTVRLIPDQVRKGMHFWAPGGLWSTEIVSSVDLDEEIQEEEQAETQRRVLDWADWEDEDEEEDDIDWLELDEVDLEDTWEEESYV